MAIDPPGGEEKRASRGIGAAIAREFAREGAKLLLVSRSEQELQTLAKELGAVTEVHAFTADIRCEEDMQKMAERAVELFGRIDWLCQNAGIYPKVRLEEMAVADWDAVIDTNLKGTFLAVRACVPQMKRQQYGRIVLTSSISGPKTAWPGGCHYTASKAGMNGFLRTVAVELAKYNICINGVEPGNIVTESLEELGKEWLHDMLRAIPLGRLGTPAETAKAHVFLASDDASYITGQTLVVDGGQILPETHYAEF